MQSDPPVRPKLTSRSLRRWVPPLVRHIPGLATAYLVPGRVPPRIREAAMLGVTSIDRCEACEARLTAGGRRRWGCACDALSPDEAGAYAFGQRVALAGPHNAGPPAEMRRRHQRELMAVSILMELANLSGNRFLAPAHRRRQHAGRGRAHRRPARPRDARGRPPRSSSCPLSVVGGARGDILRSASDGIEPRQGYAAGTVVQGIDGAALHSRSLPSRWPRRTARDPGRGRRRRVAVPRRILRHGRRDVRPVLGRRRRPEPPGGSPRPAPGGTIRLLEHARARHRAIGALQERSAPAWARVSGGCRLDHDVLRAVREAGLVVIEERTGPAGSSWRLSPPEGSAARRRAR